MFSEFCSHSQTKRLMDSLQKFISSAINDTDKVNKINKVYADELWRYNSAEPYKMLKEALGLAERSKFLPGQMNCYGNMLSYSRNRGNLDFTIRFTKEYLRIAIILKDSISYGRGIGNMGATFRDKGEYDSALIYQNISRGIFERFHADKDKMARIYAQLGMTYTRMKKDSLALLYAKKGLDLREEINYADGIDASLSQLVGIYDSQKNYPKIIEYASKAMVNRVKDKDSIRVGDYLSMIGYAQTMMGNFKTGIENQEKALKIVLRHLEKNSDQLYAIYLRLFESYDKKGDHKNALFYFKIYKSHTDSMLNIEKIRSVSNFQTLYDVEDKESQIKLLDQETRIQNQDLKFQRYGLIFGTVLLLAVILISFYIYKAYNQKKSANILLADQKKMIEEKNKEVMDSINYAKRLQNAILVPEQELTKHFPEIFVLFKPKDIVSGDFYWFSESPDNKIIAVADCTGHGVPGGFMSMLGYESLQNVALKENITTTSEALKLLDRKITDALNKSDRTFRDGMDIALCAFSRKENKLLYSGANRPLIQISKGVLTEHKPDKNTIGGDIDNTDKKYTTKNIECVKGDTFYMFTDGYADQFGGPAGRKFMMKQLKELLVSVSSLPMKEQKEKLENTINSWKGNLEQIDDVCLIGIRV